MLFTEQPCWICLEYCLTPYQRLTAVMQIKNEFQSFTCSSTTKNKWMWQYKKYVTKCKGSVTIVADFSPEFNIQFRWRSEHQPKNHRAYQ